MPKRQLLLTASLFDMLITILILRLERRWILHLDLVDFALPLFSPNLITPGKNRRSNTNAKCSNN
ncbi:hypothetical protein ACFLYS_03180 [Chloroflexota bacterium]